MADEPATSSLPASKGALNLYTLSELQAISADLSENGSESGFYDEFQGYIADGSTWTSGTLQNLPENDAKGNTITYAEADTVMQLHVIGINHDTLSSNHTTKAGLTLQAAHALPVGYRMNETLTNAGGWAASELRTTMNSGAVWNMMPADLQAAIVPVDKVSGTTYNSTSASDITTTSDKIFVPSYVEIAGSHLSDYSAMAAKGWAAEEGAQYAYYATRVTNGYDNNTSLANMNKTNSAAAFANGNGTVAYTNLWWERSCDPNNSGRFVACGDGGDPSYADIADLAFGVLPCFCI